LRRAREASASSRARDAQVEVTDRSASDLEADGGFVAECLTGSIVTQADDWGIQLLCGRDFHFSDSSRFFEVFCASDIMFPCVFKVLEER